MYSCQFIYYKRDVSIDPGSQDTRKSEKETIESDKLQLKESNKDSEDLFPFDWKKCNIENILETLVSDKKNVIAGQQVRKGFIFYLQNFERTTLGIITECNI